MPKIVKISNHFINEGLNISSVKREVSFEVNGCDKPSVKPIIRGMTKQIMKSNNPIDLNLFGSI